MAGQKTGDETLIFMYDNNGDAFGFIYNGEEYYYIKNVQNDIVAIADKNGTVVANYYYDAWGNITQITGDTALAQTNPLRYRSYYYDSETGYYHLKSRYYNPELCRFINADSVDVLDEDQNNVLENNLFAYCLNNPVNMVDYDGNSAIAIAGGYGLYVWAFAGANAWNIIGQVVLVGMAVVTIVLAIKIVYDKTSGKKTTKNGSQSAGHRTTRNGSKRKTNDKHTRPRPGRQSEKKKMKPSWKRRR